MLSYTKLFSTCRLSGWLKIREGQLTTRARELCGVLRTWGRQLQPHSTGGEAAGRQAATSPYSGREQNMATTQERARRESASLCSRSDLNMATTSSSRGKFTTFHSISITMNQGGSNKSLLGNIDQPIS